jgi:hypothetical protein
MEEPGLSEENHRPVANDYQTLYHNVVSSTQRMSRVHIHNISDIRR